MRAPDVLHRYILPLEVVVRTTREEDLPGLEWFGLFTGHRELIREAYDRQERGEVVMLLAEVNDFPAAQAWVDLERRAAASTGYIWAVRVNPVFQGQGMGSRVLAAAEDVIRDHGFHAAELGVEKDNPGARRLYERAGYHVTHDAYEEYEFTDEEGEPVRVPVDQWVMRKPLIPEREHRRRRG